MGFVRERRGFHSQSKTGHSALRLRERWVRTKGRRLLFGQKRLSRPETQDAIAIWSSSSSARLLVNRFPRRFCWCYRRCWAASKSLSAISTRDRPCLGTAEVEKLTYAFCD